MRLSVVVPHRDCSVLGRCLAALESGTRAPDELVVVDDGSTGAPEVGESSATLLTQPHRGPAAARNLGARASSGDVLVFVDADVEVSRTALACLEARLLAEPELTAVQGLYAADCPVPTVAARLSNLLQRRQILQVGDHPFAGLSSFCVAIRRSAFERTAGFDERLARPTVEDDNLGLELAALGYRIAVDPTVEVSHHATPTSAGLCRRMAAMAEDRVRTLDTWRRHRPPRGSRTHHRPALLAATALAGTALALGPLGLPIWPLVLLAQADRLTEAAQQYGVGFASRAAPLLMAMPAAAAVGVARGAFALTRGTP